MGRLHTLLGPQRSRKQSLQSSWKNEGKSLPGCNGRVCLTDKYMSAARFGGLAFRFSAHRTFTKSGFTFDHKGNPLRIKGDNQRHHIL